VPAWTTPAGGGGLTLIATGTPSAATTISFTSIPTTYKHLLLRWETVFQSASGQWYLRVNSDSGSAYFMRASFIQGAGVLAEAAAGAKTSFGYNGDTAVVLRTGTGSTDYDRHGQGNFVIYDYADTAKVRTVEWNSFGEAGTASQTYIAARGVYSTTGTAVTDIELIRSSTQTITGTFYLYGVS
jgi:hypothetical protein